jgi:N6-L-threonylcarbamoyladenine synthase
VFILGIETSCDDTGIAIYHTTRGLLSHALYSQTAMHSDYGGVVPELASRDHIRRVLPLVKQTLSEARLELKNLNAIAYTQGPGLAGALLVGSSFAAALSFALKIPAIGIHHLEGHLLSPLLSTNAPLFPFVALLVSGGHTQLMEVHGVGQYKLLGETVDDAAGEAFDKTAKLLGLSYPGGPAISMLADKFSKSGKASSFILPRPMLHSGNLNFSFSGHKHKITQEVQEEIAYAFQEAVVDVLTQKSIAALTQTGLNQLVVAGGVSANCQLRKNLSKYAEKIGATVFYPSHEFCTDNGAMIALAGAMRLQEKTQLATNSFTVKPRWDLEAHEMLSNE